jgi:hypothetical protein
MGFWRGVACIIGFEAVRRNLPLKQDLILYDVDKEVNK